jgi:hypothetical protein
VTRRFWLTVVSGGESILTRVEPDDLAGARVTVRVALLPGESDGVWVDGQRSYDTYVFIDGAAAYYSQARHEAEAAFERMERSGGGRSV